MHVTPRSAYVRRPSVPVSWLITTDLDSPRRRAAAVRLAFLPRRVKTICRLDAWAYYVMPDKHVLLYLHIIHTPDRRPNEHAALICVFIFFLNIFVLRQQISFFEYVRTRRTTDSVGFRLRSSATVVFRVARHHIVCIVVVYVTRRTRSTPLWTCRENDTSGGKKDFVTAVRAGVLTNSSWTNREPPVSGGVSSGVPTGRRTYEGYGGKKPTCTGPRVCTSVFSNDSRIKSRFLFQNRPTASKSTFAVVRNWFFSNNFFT